MTENSTSKSELKPQPNKKVKLKCTGHSLTNNIQTFLDAAFIVQASNMKIDNTLRVASLIIHICVCQTIAIAVIR